MMVLQVAVSSLIQDNFRSQNQKLQKLRIQFGLLWATLDIAL